MAIGLPITASAIRDEFSYWFKNSFEQQSSDVFNLSGYRGLVLRYPDGRQTTTGEYILTSAGDRQYTRILPQTGPLKFSDFYGSVGYFAPYPLPVIETTVPNRLEGWTNYTRVELTSQINLDFLEQEVVDWRPDISDRRIVVEWQEQNSANLNWTTIHTQNYENQTSINSTFRLTTQTLGDYNYRVKVTATSFAINDDQVPYGGDYGDLRQVSQTITESDTLTVSYTPYQPDDPEVVLKTGVWNDYKQDDGVGVGTYVVKQRAYDDVFTETPDIKLQFGTGNEAANITFDPAYGRSAQNVKLYEWEFKNPVADDLNDRDWKPISEIADTPANALDGYINWNDVNNTNLDLFEFRIKVTATQTLYDPNETLQVIEYSPAFRLMIDLILLQPSFTIAGTRSVVNGGTFNKTFRPVNTPNQRYYWRVIPSGSNPGDSSDFISDSGDQVFNAGATTSFQIRTVLDQDQNTETFLLEMHDTADYSGSPVATDNLRIVYGPPDYDMSMPSRVTEDQAFAVNFRAENVGDISGRWRYTRITADSTGDNDFIDASTGVRYNADTYYNINLTVDESISNDELIVSTDSLNLRAENDSPFGGQLGNFERFRFEFDAENPFTGVISQRDTEIIRVDDDLNYQIDILNINTSSKTIEYDRTCTVDSCQITAETNGSLTWSGSSPAHVSWAEYGSGTLQYRWIVKSPNYSSWLTNYPGSSSTYYFNDTTLEYENTWRNVGDTSSNVISSTGSGRIVDRGWDRLDFENFRSTTVPTLGSLASCKWSLQFRTVPSNNQGYPLYADLRNSKWAKMTVKQNNIYVPTGVTAAFGGTYTEGKNINLTVGLRTSRMIGRKVEIILEQEEFGGYRLIGWPQFGPQAPEYSHPAMKKTITVTSNYMNISMGSVFTTYGLRENYQLVSAASHDNVSIKATARVAPNQNFRFDSANREKYGFHRVRDSQQAAVISTSKRLGSSAALLHAPNANNPVGQAKMDFYAHCINAMDRGLLMGHGGTFRAGIGWAIRRAPGQPSVDEKGNSNEPSAWFDRTSSVDFATEAGETGSVRLDKGANWHEVQFDHPINTGDEFLNAYNRRRGVYRTAVPAAEMTVLNPTIGSGRPNGKWFPDKHFEIYATGMNAGPYQTQLARAIPIIVRSRQPKPQPWGVRVSFRSEIDADSRAIYTARLVPVRNGSIIPFSQLEAEYDLSERTLSYQLTPESAFDNPRGSVAITNSEGEDEITVRLNGSTADNFDDIRAHIGVYRWEGRRIDYGSTGFNINAVRTPLNVYVSEAIYDVVDSSSSRPGGTATAAVTGGEPPYRYSWSVNRQYGSILGDPEDAEGASMFIQARAGKCAGGTYSVTVTDARGQTKTSRTGDFNLYTRGACVANGGPAHPLSVRNGSGSASGTFDRNTGFQTLSASGTIGVSGGSGSYRITWRGSGTGATGAGMSGVGTSFSASRKKNTVTAGTFYSTVTGTATVTDRVTGQTDTGTVTLRYTWTVKAPSGGGGGGGGSNGGGGGGGGGGGFNPELGPTLPF